MKNQNEEVLSVSQADLQNASIMLKPGIKLSAEFQGKIKDLGAGRPDFPTYMKRVRELFNLKPVPLDEKRNYFLAGFVEGEGSLSVSIKKNRNAKFGVELDPLFNITQHVNGVNNLYLAMERFQTGRLRYKADSNATLVFIIEPRQSLRDKVCPFIEKYLYPWSSLAKQARYRNFKLLLQLFDDNAHLDKDRFINELLPLWDSMRMQKGYAGQTFASLEEAQDYVRNYNS